MVQFKKLFLIPLLVIAFSYQNADGAIKKVAQTGFQFLKVDMNARIAGMGGAATMSVNGADAIFYNAAGMSEMNSNYDVFFTQTQWIAGISYFGGAIAAKMGNIGTFGLNFQTADYGQILGTRVASNEQGFVNTGNVDVGAFSIGLGYSRALTNKFMIGGVVKYSNQNLGQVVALRGGSDELSPETAAAIHNELGTLNYDFGTIFYPGGLESFKIGMTINNFAPEIEYVETPFELPLNFRIGASVDVTDIVDIANSSWLVAIDALHPRDYTERLHLGTEYIYADMVVLRAGYKYNYDEEGLSAGFGLRYGFGGVDFKFDYAYSAFGVFNNVNRFTIGASF